MNNHTELKLKVKKTSQNTIDNTKKLYVEFSLDYSGIKREDLAKSLLKEKELMEKV